MTLIQIKKDRQTIKDKYGHYDPHTQSILDYREHYPLEYLETIFQKLAIEDEDHKYEFIEQICYAAWCYSCLKKEKSKKFTKAYNLQELKKLQNTLVKTIKAIKKIEYDYFQNSYAQLTHDAFEILLEQDEELRNSLSKSLLSQADTKRIAAIFEDHTVAVLENLYNASQSVDIEQFGNYNSNQLRALGLWLSEIADPWLKYSTIPFTAGTSYSGISYNSEAMYILKDIIKPIDKKVTLQNLATELRYFTKSTLKAKRQ